MRPLRPLLVAFILGAGGVPFAAAQGPSAPLASASRNACLDAIPDSSLRRVPVYLTATPQDSVGARAPVRDGIDLVTQAVAQTARGLLAASEGMLPSAEPTVTWRSLNGDVLVVARRDGSFEGRVKPRLHTSDVQLGEAGPRFVVRALESARAGGERLLVPEVMPLDSITWLLHLEPSVRNEQGDITPPKTRMGIPVFALLVPAERQVRAEHVRVSYPLRLRSAGLMGKVLMRFIVDTTGRVDPATVRDLFPAGHAPLSADDQAAYDEFVRSIRRGLGHALYTPARVGGCVVRQLVQQPFSFKLADGQWPDP